MFMFFDPAAVNNIFLDAKHCAGYHSKRFTQRYLDMIGRTSRQCNCNVTRCADLSGLSMCFMNVDES